MDQIIIHVDMDAFYASVEVRDNPELRGKPVIIGALPQERGVVATCCYEAREYGVHSAMNVKEAYRLCPEGVFIHPNFDKYRKVSHQIHKIWNEYCTAMEPIALDEAYLDVTETAVTFEKAGEFARTIKKRVLNEVGLTCSIGVAYSKSAAKTASEEMKPNGYFEIHSPQEFVDLIIDRNVRVVPSVGEKTAERLNEMEIYTVRDLYDREMEVMEHFGSQGAVLMDLAKGLDDRRVTPYRPEDAKSISREITFQEDVYDYEFLKDVLFLLALSVETRAGRYNLHGNGVVLKITYSDMKSITRSRVTKSCDDALSIHREAVEMLNTLKKRPVRLIGAGVYNLTEQKLRQVTLDELFDTGAGGPNDREKMFDRLEKRYHIDFSKLMGQMDRSDSLHRLVEDMRIQRLIPSARGPRMVPE